jgi:hypothetical protein
LGAGKSDRIKIKTFCYDLNDLEQTKAFAEDIIESF